MTIESQKTKSGPYALNGVQRVFDFDFRIESAGGLRVVRVIDGMESEITNGTVAITGPASGTVTLPTALSGGQLMLVRRTPHEQRTDYNNQRAVRPETVERDLDLLVMQVQEMAETLRRALKVPVTENPTGDDVAVITARVFEIADALPELYALHGKLAELMAIEGSLPELTEIYNNLSDILTIAQNIDGIFDAVDRAEAAAAAASKAPNSWAQFQSGPFSDMEDGVAVTFNAVQFVRDRSANISDLPTGAGWKPLGTVNLRHFGAVCDGVTNDGDAVKAASRFGGVIKVNGRVLMNGKTVIDVAAGTTFKGRGKFLKTMYSNDPTVAWFTNENAIDHDTFFRLNGASGVLFKCGFETTNALGRIYGITATDCLNVIADGCAVGPATGYGHMYFMFLLGNTRASGARKCFARNLGSFFVTGGTLDNQHNSTTFVRDFFCDDNRVEETNSEALDVNFNSQGGTIHRNYIRNCAKNDGVTGEPVDVGGGVCGNISVCYNTFLCGGYSQRGIWFKTSADAGSKMFGVKFVGNLIDGQKDYTQGTDNVAVQLSNDCSDVLIEGNTIKGFTRAFNTFPAIGVRIKGNDITAHQIGGINGPDVLFEGNAFNQVVGSTTVALAVIGPRARIVNNDFNMQGGICLNTTVDAPDVVFTGNTVKGGTRAANLSGARATVTGNTMSGQTERPVTLQATAISSKVKDNNMLALPASASTGVFISTGCNGFDVSENYVEFAAASTVAAYIVQGACDGAVLRGNRARRTTTAASGLTNLTNSLSENPLLIPA